MSEDHHHCNHFVGKYLGPWKTPLFPMLNHGQANRTLTSQSFCKLVLPGDNRIADTPIKTLLKLFTKARTGGIGTITRSAGASFGQEMPPECLEPLINELNRRPQQRTTLYGTPTKERIDASFNAPSLRPETSTLASRYERGSSDTIEHVHPRLSA
ncbi:MAG: hypothetical protein VB959_20010, partial [Rhodospirillales bacterium]